MSKTPPKQPSVLVCAPQHESKAYCFPDWISNVKSFSYPNFEIYLSDNSDKNNFIKKIRIQHRINADHINSSEKSGIMRMAQSHEQCREHAMKMGFEWMLHLETDIFPKPDIIESLLSCHQANKKIRVVAAPYYIGLGKHSHLCVFMTETAGNEFYKSTWAMSKDHPQFLDGMVKQVYSAGLGCVLIHRSIFSKIKFRADRTKRNHPDTYFAYDLFNEGIVFWLDTSLLCDHRNQDWGVYGIQFD